MWIIFLNYLWALLGFISNGVAFPRPLSRAEEAELLAKFRDGDRAARDKLIEHNLRLVSHICKKFKTTNVCADDLLSIGSIGLIKGIDTYKRGNDTRLATYLSRCIENEVLMYLRKTKKNANDASLDECIGVDKDGKEFSRSEVISDEDADVFELTAKKLDIERILERVDFLEERERKVIIMRYGLDNKKPRTQSEVAKTLNISRSYVSRIETAALKKLAKQ